MSSTYYDNPHPLLQPSLVHLTTCTGHDVRSARLQPSSICSTQANGQRALALSPVRLLVVSQSSSANDQALVNVDVRSSSSVSANLEYYVVI